MSSFLKPRNAHRRAGNVHRDAREWQLAAAEYRLHLAERDGDVAIWIQLGHVEKEGGKVDAAEAAYRRAAELAPADPDPWLHLGHMLKQAGRADDALDAFRRLFRLMPEDEETSIELNRLAQRQRRVKPVITRPGSAVFALDDFFDSFEQHSTFTGIQRVQAGVVLAALDDPDFDAHCIVSGPDQGGGPEFLRIDEEAFRGIVACASSDPLQPAHLRVQLMEARLTARPATIGADSVIVLLGAFWVPGIGIDRYLPAIARGARLAAFVHDVIPVSHPQFCELPLTNAFWRALAVLVHVVDFIFTNSDHTQAELRRFVAEQGGRQVPMVTVPLAHAVREPTTATPPRPPQLGPVRNRYVAYVSTVEGRKNHLYVVQAWQRLIAGGVSVPDLVFAGRKGWRTDALDRLLAETGNLGGRVHIVHGLSDAELDGVYAHALFTVFTSVAEGWGIPVGESLVHGTPVVASRVASIPEVGGDFVDYVDPDDLDQGIAVLRRMIEDGAYRKHRRAAIAAGFVPRSWRDVGDDLIARFRQQVAALAPSRGVTRIALPPGVVVRPGTLVGKAAPPPRYFADPIGVALADSFYEPEPIGVWMRGRGGEIAFRAVGHAGRRIVLLVAIEAAGWATAEPLSITTTMLTAGVRHAAKLGRGRNLMRLETTVNADESVVVLFDYRGPVEPPAPDSRRFGIGLSAIGWARVDDAAGRAELRETMTFG